MPMAHPFSDQYIFYCIYRVQRVERQSDVKKAKKIKTLEIHINYDTETRQNIPIGFILFFIKCHRLPIARIPLPDNMAISSMWKALFSIKIKYFSNSYRSEKQKPDTI